MFLSKMDNHLNYSLPLSRNIRLIEYRPESINWNGDLSPVLWENPGPYEDSSPTNPLILSKLARVSKIFRDACKCESFPFHYFANFPYLALVEDGHLIERLRREKFDLAMTEQYDNCALVILDNFKTNPKWEKIIFRYRISFFLFRFGIFKLASIDRSLWLSATGIYRMQPEVLGVNYPLSYVSGKLIRFYTYSHCNSKIISFWPRRKGNYANSAFSSRNYHSIFSHLLIIIPVNFAELFAPLSDEMTLLDRIHNLLVAAATGIMYAFTRRRESKIFHNREHKISNILRFLFQFLNYYYELVRKLFLFLWLLDLLTLSRETSGVIVNSNPLFDFPAPSSHQFSFVGGFSIVKSEEQLSPVVILFH